MNDFHPLVKQLLDGEISLADLPAGLRAEGEEALRLLAAVDRRPVAMPDITARVMRDVRARAVRRSLWRRLAEPQEIRLRIRPWTLIPALGLAALVIWLARPERVHAPENLATVRFTLVAPEAHQVSVAGTFNNWDPSATPLVRAQDGTWTGSVSLPPGQHLYSFVVDGSRWLADPAAPAVEDGFGGGRRNSVLAL